MNILLTIFNFLLRRAKEPTTILGAAILLGVTPDAISHATDSVAALSSLVVNLGAVAAMAMPERGK